MLVLSTARGAGPVPDDGDCEVVEVALAPAGVGDRRAAQLDALAHDLPAEAVAAIERFDPDRAAVWHPGNFVTTDEPPLGRELLGGRRGRSSRSRTSCAPTRSGRPPASPTRRTGSSRRGSTTSTAASDELATPLGTVWSGDARDGFNGAGNYVRWVLDEADRAAGVRVLRAALRPGAGAAVPRRRPVLGARDGAARRHGGVPAGRDRDPARPGGTAVRVRRAVVVVGPARAPTARRCAATPAASASTSASGTATAAPSASTACSTADGFRPTELNTRVSAGLTQLGKVAGEVVQLVQDHLVAGHDTGLGAADLESLLPLMDEQRSGRAVAVGEGGSAGGSDEYAVAWDGRQLTRTEEETGNVLVLGDTPSGFFAKIEPCAALTRGERLGPLNAGLMRYLDGDLRLVVRRRGGGPGPALMPGQERPRCTRP